MKETMADKYVPGISTCYHSDHVIRCIPSSL